MNAKDWFTVITASFALIISAGTAYFNVIREIDDARVVIWGAPTLTIPSNQSPQVELTLEGPVAFKFTFTNLGTRPVAITEVALGAVVHRPAQGEPCQGPWTPFDIPAFVVKPNEMVTPDLKLKGGKHVLKVTDADLKRSTVDLEACAAFRIVTMDNQMEVAFRPIARYPIEFGKDTTRTLPTPRPEILTQHYSTSFKRFWSH